MKALSKMVFEGLWTTLILCKVERAVVVTHTLAGREFLPAEIGRVHEFFVRNLMLGSACVYGGTWSSLGCVDQLAVLHGPVRERPIVEGEAWLGTRMAEVSRGDALDPRLPGHARLASGIAL